MNPDSIRPATASDSHLLGAVQLSAGALFRSLPELAWIADEEVGAPAAYLPMIAAGTVWVAEDSHAAICGVLLSDILQDELHIVELAVAREAQQRGIGRALLDAAVAFARANALRAVTLTTFRHVAWNAPFYARYGFVELAGDALNARLRETVHAETERGLPNRCAMRMAI